MSITLQKLVGAVLFALIVVVGLNLLIDDVILPERKPIGPAPHLATGTAAPGAAVAQAPATEPDKPLAVRLTQASVAKGEAAAKKCQTCHTFNPGGPAKVGPNLSGVLGRDKGRVGGFSYSDGMKTAGGAWSYDDLDKFLTKPSAFVSGTKMTFAGLPDAQERADVIAYLKSISPDAPPVPAP